MEAKPLQEFDIQGLSAQHAAIVKSEGIPGNKIRSGFIVGAFESPVGDSKPYGTTLHSDPSSIAGSEPILWLLLQRLILK